MNINKALIFCFLAIVVVFSSCKKDDEILPIASFQTSVVDLYFTSTFVTKVSISKSAVLNYANLINTVNASVSSNFEISKDNNSFSSSFTLTGAELSQGNFKVYVRFAPTVVSSEEIQGDLLFTSKDFSDTKISLAGNSLELPREIQTFGVVTNFGEVTVSTVSPRQVIQVKGLNLEYDVTVTVTGAFEISKDGVSYSNSVNYSFETVNEAQESLYVRFNPTATDLGEQNETITLSANGVDDVVVNLKGTGLPVVHNYQAFQGQRMAFGGGYSQTKTALFNLHHDLTNIETVKMYVKLRCPAGGCDPWDVLANIKVKDNDSGNWIEMGRFITPYGIDNSALSRGFEIDVTDFKSLLKGSVELLARIETWDVNGWKLSVDFDFIEGIPDYAYYAVSEVLSYCDWSTSGVPYGVTIDPVVWDLDKSITIPVNSEATSLRTIISGWGHATPADSNGRGCAEWCFRTHDVKINGVNTFQHNMGPIGCSANPVSPQGGNWSPDRAGWCPGMDVPVRVNNLATPMAGSTFTFEYDYEDWTADGGSQSGTPGAYYATSTYIIVKSNTPIVKPTVN